MDTPPVVTAEQELKMREMQVSGLTTSAHQVAASILHAKTTIGVGEAAQWLEAARQSIERGAEYLLRCSVALRPKKAPEKDE